MRRPPRFIVLLSAIALLISGCTAATQDLGKRNRVRTPYAIKLECGEASLEIGKPVRVVTVSGQMLVGRLRAVNCDATGVLVVDVNQRTGVDSTAVMSLDEVASLEVLSDTRSGRLMAGLGIVLITTIVTLVIIGTALSQGEWERAN